MITNSPRGKDRSKSPYYSYYSSRKETTYQMTPFRWILAGVGVLCLFALAICLIKLYQIEYSKKVQTVNHGRSTKTN